MPRSRKGGEISRKSPSELKLVFKPIVSSAAKQAATCWRTPPPTRGCEQLHVWASLHQALTSRRPAKWLAAIQLDEPIGDDNDQVCCGPRFGPFHAGNRSGCRRPVLPGGPGIRPHQQLRLRRLRCLREHSGRNQRPEWLAT